MSLPDIRIQNTGEAQSNVPFTFSQVFKAGDLMQGEGLAGKLSDGSTIPLQVDFKASHGDKSVRHAIVSGILPSLAKDATAKFDLVKTARVSDGFHAWPSVDAKVTLTIAGAVYTAAMPQSWNDQAHWMLGNIVDEMSFDAPLVDKSGAAHPLLTVKFAARLYHATKAVRVEVIVENTKTWQPNAGQFTYDVSVDISGKTVFSQKALTHYHHSRWHQYFWTGATPAIHIQHNTAYLIASRAVSNYEQLTIPEEVLQRWGGALTPDNSGLLKIGPLNPDMHNAGGRGDIGPLPEFTVIYLLSMDKRAKDAMIAAADGSGAWNMHYRDEKTGAPIRTDNAANKRISTHWNAIDKPEYPFPIPRYAANGGAQAYSHDPAHLPSLAYLPYLVTGERFYLEELQFWAATNPLETSPEDHAGLGLMRWHQLRGQAWGLRTLGDAAYASPDADPMKTYFVKQVANNLDFYHQTYVVGNPNNLGAYDGSGENAFFDTDQRTGIQGASPWQDAFFTWALGYLVELNFEQARPVFEWKSKFATGRLTDPGYCPIMSTAYGIGNLRDGVGRDGKVYSTFADLYKANYSGDMIKNDNDELRAGPSGVKFIDLPCYSQAQGDYLSYIHGGTYGWPAGRFMGYSDFVLGVPAQVQPAVALAATLNAPGATKAWSVFDKRLVKPNYSQNPQWDIIPRTDVTVTPPVTLPPPVVIPPPTPAKKGKITVSSNVNLKKMTKLLIQVFNPATRELIRSFDNVTANSKGGFVLEDATLKAKTACAYVVIDAKGKALVINLTTII
jgi:hypothetical protein